MGTIPGEESNSLRRTWCARVINTLEILKFSPHEEAIFLYRRCREPTPFYWSHHFQIFHLCFTSLKCKLFYKPFSSVSSAVNNKYRWVVFFFFSQQRTCSCFNVREKNFFSLFLSFWVTITTNCFSVVLKDDIFIC